MLAAAAVVSSVSCRRRDGGAQTESAESVGAPLAGAVLELEGDGVRPFGVVVLGGQLRSRSGAELLSEFVAERLVPARVVLWLIHTAEAVARALVHHDGCDVLAEGDGVGPGKLRLPPPVVPPVDADVDLA